MNIQRFLRSVSGTGTGRHRSAPVCTGDYRYRHRSAPGITRTGTGTYRHRPALTGLDRHKTGLDRHKTGTDRPGLFYDVFDKNFVLNSPKRQDI